MAADLDSFVDSALKQFSVLGYVPTFFMQMRTRWGTKEAIERLVVSGEIQSGIQRLKKLDLLDLSIEATVLKFPEIFRKDIQEAAKFRLDQIGGKREATAKVGFDEALAQAHAPTKNIDRIHVRQARPGTRAKRKTKTEVTKARKQPKRAKATGKTPLIS